ncbi:MAG: winged helix-turn-helix transcriptional regulator [Thermoplasmatota archaeon]
MRSRTLIALAVSSVALAALPVVSAFPVVGDVPAYDANVVTENLGADIAANTPLGPAGVPVAAPVPTAASAQLLGAPIATPATGVDAARLVGPQSFSTRPFDGLIPLLPDDALTLSTGFSSFDAMAATPLGSAPVWTDSRAAILAALAGTSTASTDGTSGADGSLADGTLPRATSAALPDAPLVYPASATSPPSPTSAHSNGAPLTTTSLAAPAASSSARLPTAAKAAIVATVLAVPTLLGWALYHRIRGHSTLENDTRKTIYDTVCAKPGIGVQELAALTTISYSTASYHLDRLVEAHMIVVSQDGNKLRYYKNGGSFTEAERKVLPVLKNAEALRVLEAIVASPGTYRAALAEKLGVTPTTINWHLKRLNEAGLIEEVREGRNAYLSVPPARVAEAFAPLVPKLDASEAPLAESARRVLAASGHTLPAPVAAVAPLAA